MGAVGGAAPKPGLLADANVVIDYANSDIEILTLVGARIGPLAVAASVFNEVRQVTREDCDRLGISVITTTDEQGARALVMESACSFHDRLAFIICQDEGRVCVTNDRGLQELCEANGVPTRFGLGLMIDLVRCGALDPDRALAVSQQIGVTNPLFINEKVLGQFAEALAALN